MGKNTALTLLSIVCLPGLLSATCSTNSTDNDSLSPLSLTSQDGPSPSSSSQNRRRWESSCVNGWCGADGVCNCNPCWTGSTCQVYVDRFAPRFLAEEPFFMVVMGSEREGESEVPLFRIESADDDLGLTCPLGQDGPAATCPCQNEDNCPCTSPRCPCATPRYKVVGPSSTVFRADQETGDVFIKPGYSLQPGKIYTISLQVAALEVNASQDYERWTEELSTSLYIKPVVEEEEDGDDDEEEEEDNNNISSNNDSESEEESEHYEEEGGGGVDSSFKSKQNPSLSFSLFSSSFSSSSSSSSSSSRSSSKSNNNNKHNLHFSSVSSPSTRSLRMPPSHSSSFSPHQHTSSPSQFNMESSYTRSKRHAM